MTAGRRRARCRARRSPSTAAVARGTPHPAPRSRRSAPASFRQFVEGGVYARFEVRKREVGERRRDVAARIGEDVEDGGADLREAGRVDEEPELAVAQRLAAAVVAAADA